MGMFSASALCVCVSIVLPVLGHLWPPLSSEAAAEAAYEPSGSEMLTFQLTEVRERKLMYLNVNLHKTKEISYSPCVLQSPFKKILKRLLACLAQVIL